jgi:TPR repeat protein
MGKSTNDQISPPPSAAAVSTTPSVDEADTQCARGLWCANQVGTPNYTEAAVWYRKAADQGHPLAQCNLGVMYAIGQGLDRDDVQAALWFEKAASRGDGGAQFNLGRMCHRASLDKRSDSTGESRIEAYKWFRLASDQGYQGADIALTLLFKGMSSEEVTEGNRRAADVVEVTA